MRVRRASSHTLSVPPRPRSLRFGRQDFVHADGTEDVSTPSFPDEGRGSSSSGRIHTISLGHPESWACLTWEEHQSDLLPEKAAAVLPRTGSIFASFQFLPNVCWEDTDQLLWNSRAFQHTLPLALTLFINQGTGVGMRWGLWVK